VWWWSGWWEEWSPVELCDKMRFEESGRTREEVIHNARDV